MNRFASLHALLLVALTAACTPARPPAEDPHTGTPTDTLAGEPGDQREATSTIATDDSSELKQLVAAGRAVFLQQHCGVCHRLDTADTRGSFGPTHNGMGTTADGRIGDPKYTGAATTAEAYMRESIVDPVIYIVPGYELNRYPMPAYTILTEEDLHSLVQMLLQER